jgi:hypothetical protein
VLGKPSSFRVRCLQVYLPTITLVTKSLDVVALFLTCRLVYAESMAVLEPRIKLLNQEPMRYMVDVEKFWLYELVD